MLLDSSNQFSASQAVTALGSTASTNIIDLGVAPDIGDAVTNKDLFLLCQVATAFASGGSATPQVQVQSAPDNGSGSPATTAASADTHAPSAAPASPWST